MRARHGPLLRLAPLVGVAALGLAPGLEVAAAPSAQPVPAGQLPQNVKAALGDVALESAGGGRLRHRGNGFTAIIHPDGSVEFRDDGGTGGVNLFGLDLFRRRFREPEPERHSPSWTGVLERASFPQGRFPLFGTAEARFGGLADGRRKDRHRSEKRAFMAATEKLRFEMAHAWYRAQMQRELADLGGQLTEVWRDTKQPLAERKRLIFERWADCEPPGPSGRSELDALRLEVARTARAKIEAFVRVVAPPGSPEAYTEAELRRLHRGRSEAARFRPYDAPARREDEPTPGGSEAPDDAPPAPEAQPSPATTPPARPVGPDPEPGWFRPSRAG